MQLDLSADQELFRATTRAFLEKECPLERVRELSEDAKGFDQGWWRRGAELGWTSLLVDPHHGGGSLSEHGLCDLAIVAEEMGRLAAPGPLLPTNVVAATVSELGTAAQREQLLGALCSGDAIAAWCWGPAAGDVAVQAGRTESGWLLTGAVPAVEAGCEADHLLVTAAGSDGVTQFLVPSSAPGVEVRTVGSIDAVRRFATVTLTEVPVAVDDVVGEVGAGGHGLDRQWQTAMVLQCAETVGAIDRVLEFTCAWAFDRYSFGRPLASYQALKHRFADMKTWLESSHAIAAAATRAVAHGRDDAAELIRIAKCYLAQYAPKLVQDCVQMHGGIGVTWEHDIHLYLRRVTLNRSLYGTPEQTALELADLMEV